MVQSGAEVNGIWNSSACYLTWIVIDTKAAIRSIHLSSFPPSPWCTMSEAQHTADDYVSRTSPHSHLHEKAGHEERYYHLRDETDEIIDDHDV
jgi:hypothetical protein